jgi:hypothetical protein
LPRGLERGNFELEFRDLAKEIAGGHLHGVPLAKPARTKPRLDARRASEARLAASAAKCM